MSSFDSMEPVLRTTPLGLRPHPARFNLLLLESGDIYFEDAQVEYIVQLDAGLPGTPPSTMEGSLKLCLHCIVFDPRDQSEPLIMLKYEDISFQMWNVPVEYQMTIAVPVLQVRAKAAIRTKAHNRISPRKRVVLPEHFLFIISRHDPKKLLSRMQECQRATMAPTRPERQALTRTIIDTQSKGVVFHPSWLVDHTEVITDIADLVSQRVLPLTTIPGTVILTNKRVYFHAFYNDSSDGRVTSWELRKFTHIFKRRHMLRHVGLELFMSDQDSVMISFQAPADRERFYDVLIMQDDLVCLKRDTIEQATKKWQQRELTNYEYLMFLNLNADRTFNDLRQYPVFPWVIQDYNSEVLDLTATSTFRDLSKPIGALNSVRLDYLRKRYREMPRGKQAEELGLPQPFMYGSHYSTPNFVIHYLVRAAPEYALNLQNGEFDTPDRLFWSVADTWTSVCNSMSDFKELIPEFYEPPGDFLVNVNNLDLGVTQRGVRVHDVILPPWASDPRDFTTKLREALECDYVSAHLHEWIDLIFGYKQRGRDAEAADNVFHYLTYEDSVDLEAIADPHEREVLQMQINEFGQCPKQIFAKPHPARYASPGSELLFLADSRFAEMLNAPPPPPPAAIRAPPPAPAPMVVALNEAAPLTGTFLDDSAAVAAAVRPETHERVDSLAAVLGALDRPPTKPVPPTRGAASRPPTGAGRAVPPPLPKKPAQPIWERPSALATPYAYSNLMSTGSIDDLLSSPVAPAHAPASTAASQDLLSSDLLGGPVSGRAVPSRAAAGSVDLLSLASPVQPSAFGSDLLDVLAPAPPASAVQRQPQPAPKSSNSFEGLSWSVAASVPPPSQPPRSSNSLEGLAWTTAPAPAGVQPGRGVSGAPTMASMPAGVAQQLACPTAPPSATKPAPAVQAAGKPAPKGLEAFDLKSMAAALHLPTQDWHAGL